MLWFYIILSNYKAEHVTHSLRAQISKAITKQFQSQTRFILQDTYLNDVKLTDVSDKIKADLSTLNAKSSPPKTPEEVIKLLCTHLYLAPLRFDFADEWSTTNIEFLIMLRF